jgi:signal transduction histidine kinase
MSVDVNEIIEKSGRRHVWQLTATGIAGYVATLLAVWFAQSVLLSEHDYLDEIRHSLSDVVHAAEVCAGDESQSLSSVLLANDLQGLESSEEFDNGIDLQLAKMQNVTGTGSGQLSQTLVKDLDLAIAAERNIDVERGKVKAWTTIHASAKAALAIKHQKAYGLLNQLRQHFLELEGAAKLAIVVKQRQLRDAGSDHQSEIGSDIVSYFKLGNDALQAKADVVDLLVGIEQLAGTTDRDQLTNLRDNILLPTLARLRSHLPDETSRRLVEEFATALLGESDAVDNSSDRDIATDASLYVLRDRMCQLEREQNNLVQSVAKAFNAFRAVVDQMNSAVLLMSEQWADSSRIAVRYAWIFTVVVSGVCASVFVVLAKLIAKTISIQFQTLHGACSELDNVQRLESIGQLAAGIAHEINTPMQFVQDNTEFLQDCFGKLLENVLGEYQICLDPTEPQRSWGDRWNKVRRVLEENKFDRIQREVPKAIEETLDGIDRVIRIVRAMKEFSHPANEQQNEMDINQAINSSVTITRNRWKYASNMQLDLEPGLPPLVCVPTEVNQVFLNLIVNAADAITEKVSANSDEKGTITIRSRHEINCIVVEIEDTGCGIPDKIRRRIFDPFFTTKEVGKGTGQGLAICRRIVVDKYHGTLEVESEPGVGSLFRVSIPLTVATQPHHSAGEYESSDLASTTACAEHGDDDWATSEAEPIGAEK